MTTTTPILGVSFVRAAEMLATHLTDHDLPAPVSLTVTTWWEHSKISAQTRCATAPEVAADLLAWARTLGTVTAQAWRPLESHRVHLSIAATLTDPAGAVELDIFATATDDPALFADLNPGERRTVSLEELRCWAAPTTNNPAQEALRAQR